MSHVIGNRIQHLINEALKGAKDPEQKRKEIIDGLQKTIRPNRLNGLLKGTYTISRDEIWFVKSFFKCNSADDVVVVHEGAE